MKTTASILLKALCILIALSIVISLAPSGFIGPGAPSAAYAADAPVPVDGRILPMARTGDSSDWIEIAQYSGYSLIIRRKPINNSLDQYNTSLVNSYSASLCRKEINNWYNKTLSATAKLRDFAVTSTAMSQLGTYGSIPVDGISMPLGGQSKTGDDIAFALSNCEAIFYCSTQYIDQWTPAKVIPSSTIAYNNYHKLQPSFTTKDMTPAAYWLRSPGAVYYAAGCVAYTGGAPLPYYPYSYEQACGRAASHTVIGTYGYYRPAIWVGSGIFEEQGKVIVTFRDVNNPSTPLLVDTHPVPAGPYGPYDAKPFAGYDYIGLGAGSDPISGTISDGETKAIIHEYKLAAKKYTVSYDPNGGTGSAKSYEVADGASHTVSDQGYTYAGFEFKHWNTKSDGTGDSYSNGDSILVTKDIKLYAIWTPLPITYDVTYDPNGGKGAINTYTMDANLYHNVFPQGYTYEGHTFTGWNTKADGSGTSYENGDALFMDKDYYLFAQWAKDKPITYDVTYDPNGGKGTINTYTMDANQYHDLFPQGYTYEGHTFTGWNTKADGSGTPYEYGDSLFMDKDYYLFAQWAKDKPTDYTITYYPNGGSGAPKEYLAEENEIHIVSSQGYAWSGHDFICWNTKADGTGVPYYDDDLILVTSDIDLHAQWKDSTPKYYDVTYYPNGGTGEKSPPYKVAPNGTHTIRSMGYTNGDYEFDGWNTKPDGTGTPYQNKDIILVTSDIDLYAQWKTSAAPISITYKANGGVGADVVDYGTGGFFIIKDNMFGEPSYREFDCWATESGSGGAEYYNGDTITLTSSLVLYARWMPKAN